MKCAQNLRRFNETEHFNASGNNACFRCVCGNIKTTAPVLTKHLAERPNAEARSAYTSKYVQKHAVPKSKKTKFNLNYLFSFEKF